MSNPHDRPTTEPGGCECMKCGIIFIGAEHHDFCGVCIQIVADEIAAAQGLRPKDQQAP